MATIQKPYMTTTRASSTARRTLLIYQVVCSTNCSPTRYSNNVVRYDSALRCAETMARWHTEQKPYTP